MLQSKPKKNTKEEIIMALTIWNWILIVITALAGIAIGIWLICNRDSKFSGIMFIVIGILVAVLLAFGLSWWHNNTASGARAMKDYQSNMNNGLNREITITAMDKGGSYERQSSD